VLTLPVTPVFHSYLALPRICVTAEQTCAVLQVWCLVRVLALRWMRVNDVEFICNHYKQLGH
jgi:hypothetical protein